MGVSFLPHVPALCGGWEAPLRPGVNPVDVGSVPVYFQSEVELGMCF